MKDLQKLSTKHLQMIEWECENPTAPNAELARVFGLSKQAVCVIVNSPIYVEARAKRLKEIWRSSVKVAQRTMLNLAEQGDRQAAQFILQTNNYAPEQSVDVNTGLIRLNVTND